jgi:hypothetical protein
MKHIYRGFHPYIVSDFIRGKTVWFRRNESEVWDKVAPYEFPSDVYRVSNNMYEFTLKLQISTANIHVHVCPRSGHLWATADQQPCADNIKVTFNEHGTPVKAEII